MELNKEGWQSMYNTLQGVVKKVDMKKIGDRTSLLWKLSERNGADDTYFDEHLKGQVKKSERRSGRTSKRYGRRHESGALRICREKSMGEKMVVRRSAPWKIRKSVRREMFLCGESDRSECWLPLSGRSMNVSGAFFVTACDFPSLVTETVFGFVFW